MGNIIVDIFPPSYWQDFEKLTLDIAKIEWQDSYAERHGREGQAQGGVDIFGRNKNNGERTGIQCKKRAFKTKPSHETPSNTLTTNEIDEELTNLDLSDHSLDRFIIATSGPRDADLQQHVADLNDAEPEIKVAIKFWDDYVDFLNNHPDLMYRYYENVLKHRNMYDPTTHYLLLLSMAFDRPALKTTLHRENQAVEFIKGISNTQQAISTGRLVDREDRIIDQVRVPKPKPKGLTAISNRLEKCRKLATKALSDGIIVQDHFYIEIRDDTVTRELNNLRSDAIHRLNIVLEEHNIEKILFGEY